MKIRLRRPLRVLPGIRFNLGNRGAKVRFQRQGAWHAVGRHGNRAALCLPAGDLGHSMWPAGASAVDPRPGRRTGWFDGLIALAGGLLAYWLVRRFNG